MALLMQEVRSIVRKLSRLNSTLGHAYLTPSYEIDRPVPVLYPLFRADTIDAVSIGSGFIVGAKGNMVTAYGVNRTLQLGEVTSSAMFGYNIKELDEAIVELQSGRAHTLALTASGRVHAWGSNSMGQLGLPPHQTMSSFTTLEHDDIQSVATGLDNSFLLTTLGHVFSCGWAADGQTGCGDTTMRHEFTPVNVPHCVTKLSSSSDTTLVLCDNGAVYGWGNNEYHQLSPSDETQLPCPTLIPLPEEISKIAAGGSFSLFLSTSGNLYSCGYGPGTGLGGDITISSPFLVPCGSRLKAVSASLDHAAGVTSDGSLVRWGRGQHHKLVAEDESDITEPQLSPDFPNKVNHVICGPIKTCVITDTPIVNVSGIGYIEGEEDFEDLRPKIR